MSEKKNDFLGKAYEKAADVNANERKRRAYETREKALRDYDCKVPNEWEAGHKAGVAEGVKAVVEVCRELGKDQITALTKVKEKFAISEDEAQKSVQKYWKQ